MKRIFIILTSLLSWNSPDAQASDSMQPEQLEISYGNRLAGTSMLTLEHGNVLYTVQAGSQAPHTQVIPVAKEKWAVFRKDLDRLNIWGWKKEYLYPGARDGTQWHVKISYPDKSLTSKGNNAYPLEDGLQAHSRIPSTAFKAFLSALEKLTGKQLR